VRRVVSESRVMTEKEIELLANCQAEREAFVKSAVAFGVIWVVGLMVFLFLSYLDYRFTGYLFRGFAVSFFAAFFVGLISRRLVKEITHEKYRTLRKEQKQKQEQGKESYHLFFESYHDTSSKQSEPV
jgi:hypothetical protein